MINWYQYFVLSNSVCNHTRVLVYDYRPNWTPLSPQYYHYKFHFAFTLNNGNRTSCRPIRSVIIRVINKIGRPSSGEFDLLIIIITISEKTNAFFYVKELSISIIQNQGKYQWQRNCLMLQIRQLWKITSLVG